METGSRLELESLNENQVFEIVKRPTRSENGGKPNILDSKWIFKTKTDNLRKARIVIRGFKDFNCYNLRET